MPLISPVGRKSWAQRLFAGFLYVTLTIFGATMVIPFLITLSSSNSNEFDYDRFSVIPRSLWSSSDRFVKGLVRFTNRYPGWNGVLQDQFRFVPDAWTSWRTIGADEPGIDRLAGAYLNATPREMELWRRQAADYCAFAEQYPSEDCVCTFSGDLADEFVKLRYERLAALKYPANHGRLSEKALQLVSDTWGIPLPSFFAIHFDQLEIRAPLGQQSWAPPDTAKQQDYEAFKVAIRHGYGTPGVESAWIHFLVNRGMSRTEAKKMTPLPLNASVQLRAEWVEFAGGNAPASPVIPFPMRLYWLGFLGSDGARPFLKLARMESFDIARYNAMAGTHYKSIHETPFPLPPQGFDALRPAWNEFIENHYPLRLTSLHVTPELLGRYHQFIESSHTIESINQLLGTNYSNWDDFPLDARMPSQRRSQAMWVSFVESLPAVDRIIRSSEAAYQEFVLKKYGSLDATNAAYGWNLHLIEEAKPPFDKAYAITYFNHRTAFAWSPLIENYGVILRFLTQQSNAVPVTLWLIVLSVSMTLTVNPIAGYALSRFNLKGKDKIILFCLATASFPAMVSAIPGYLLMRDLGLLNTFYALVLPGAASGMSIFILKGFFDSLPQELYEAATIDGAREWQIFYFVTLPMVKPIMAIHALGAFIGAYTGWEWALIICQDSKMWTLSVWLYQASQWWAGAPWLTAAGFVIASIPTLCVFLFCQNIILRGIIVPSMK